jgi:uncharacterized delta-60 repeat protein
MGTTRFNGIVRLFLAILMGAFLLSSSQGALAYVTEEWQANYNNPHANLTDKAKSLAVDSNGNIVVTGSSFGTNYFKNDYDYATVKYSATGTQLWVSRYDGHGLADKPAAVVVDGANNVYVTGTSLVSEAPYQTEMVTIKYDTSGTELWRDVYSSSGFGFGTALAVDSGGNVYVAGSANFSHPGWNDPDLVVRKIGPDGIAIWTDNYNGPGSGSADGATAILVDGDGRVYVTGYSENEARTFDYVTIRYDSGGNRIWVARYDGPGHGVDQATAIAVDTAGNVFVTGNSFGNGTYDDYATLKYDSNGTQLWVARFNGQASLSDFAKSLAVDSDGSVYVTGKSDWDMYGRGWDFATVKYDSSGNQLWVSWYYNSAIYSNRPDVAHSIAVDLRGNVIVTGSSRSACAYDYDPNKQCEDMVTVIYDTNGVQEQVFSYPGLIVSGNPDPLSGGQAIAVDPAGNIYVAGGALPQVGPFLNGDFTTVKYVPAQPATITCPGTVSAGNYPGFCRGPVSYAVTASGTPTPTVDCSPLSGNWFPVGATNVTCTAWNHIGPPASCSFQVIVTDTEPPTIGAPDLVVNATDPSGAIVDYDRWVQFNDNCLGAWWSGSPTYGTLFPIGMTTVTLTARDAATPVHTVFATFTVEVKGPVDQLDDFTSIVAAVDTVGNLTHTIAAAQARAAEGKAAAACGLMTGFVHQVGAQSGRSLEAGTATELVNGANQIMNAMGCR